MDAFRKWLVVATLFFGSVITIGALAQPDDRPPESPAGSSYPHENLQRDANMTQQMSTANANTDSPYHSNDAQLDRSQNPSYVRALEQHQADIAMMLARRAP